jgi:hypothetical protein
MSSPDDRAIDVTQLKTAVKELGAQAKVDEDYDRLEVDLLKKFGAEVLVEKKPTEAPAQETNNAKS